MTAKDLSETLTAIADLTKALRDAGVVGRVHVGDVSFEIGEQLSSAPATQHDAQPQNPLDDPDTFGGFIPQRRVIEPRPTEEAEDEE